MDLFFSAYTPLDSMSDRTQQLPALAAAALGRPDLSPDQRRQLLDALVLGGRPIGDDLRAHCSPTELQHLEAALDAQSVARRDYPRAIAVALKP
jgi:hypothetical protein